MNNLCILVTQSESFSCSMKLVQNSKLLQDLIEFTTNKNELLVMPDFITKEIIVDIDHILHSGNLQLLEHLRLDYLLQIVNTLDFLSMSELMCHVIAFINNNLTSDNCCEIFKISFREAFKKKPKKFQNFPNFPDPSPL